MDYHTAHHAHHVTPYHHVSIIDIPKRSFGTSSSLIATTYVANVDRKLSEVAAIPNVFLVGSSTVIDTTHVANVDYHTVRHPLHMMSSPSTL